MFRKRDAQRNLFASSHLIPAAKGKRLQKSWAEAFRKFALPLIDEKKFSSLYCPDNGRPNRPVQTIVGVLLLKEMFNLTDEEALDQLEYNLLWHHALDLTLDEAHLPQKTLHNFRARLLGDDQGSLFFADMIDRILKGLGIRVNRQRLDSTHILSNMALLTRLGLFCETMRVFLKALEKAYPKLFAAVPAGVRGRYVKEDGSAAHYSDASSKDGRRRLEVCARDLYRLCTRFEDTPAAGLEAYALLQRLLSEQCTVVASDQPPDADEDDAGEEAVPVILNASHNIKGTSMQSPHDADATFCGHKGKGYSVQVSETCDADNVTQIITHVAVTDACASDAEATLPVLEALDARGNRPEEMIADTPYGSAENAVEAAAGGTELISPVSGSAPADPEPVSKEQITAEDFTLDARDQTPGRCPQGHTARAQTPQGKSRYRFVLSFDRSVCETCPRHAHCPVRLNKNGDGYVITVDRLAINRALRRRDEASGVFRPRYAIRAGIEATNSELKRAHGLGRLRVRGGLRVKLAVYLKALACNIKRMMRVVVCPDQTKKWVTA